MAELATGAAPTEQTGHLPALPTRPVTTTREAVSYAVAQSIRIAIIYTLSVTGSLMPLYRWALREGGSGSLALLGFVLGATWMLLALPLFLAARGLMRGTPPAISAPRGDSAIASSWREAGAYVLAHLIGIVALIILNSGLLNTVYVSLYRGGHPALGVMLGLTISAISAVIMFIVFIYLRRAFVGKAAWSGTAYARSATPEWAAGRSDLVGVGGWLLFLCVSLTILVPLAGLISLAADLAAWPSARVLDIYPGLGAALGLEILVKIGIGVFAFVVGFKLWNVRPGAVALGKNYFIAQLVISIVVPLIEVTALGLPDALVTIMAVAGGKAFVGSLIGFAIWFSYLNTSERVRMTYRE